MSTHELHLEATSQSNSEREPLTPGRGSAMWQPRECIFYFYFYVVSLAHMEFVDMRQCNPKSKMAVSRLWLAKNYDQQWLKSNGFELQNYAQQVRRQPLLLVVILFHKYDG